MTLKVWQKCDLPTLNLALFSSTGSKWVALVWRCQIFTISRTMEAGERSKMAACQSSASQNATAAVCKHCSRTSCPRCNFLSQTLVFNTIGKHGTKKACSIILSPSIQACIVHYESTTKLNFKKSIYNKWEDVVPVNLLKRSTFFKSNWMLNYFLTVYLKCVVSTFIRVLFTPIIYNILL